MNRRNALKLMAKLIFLTNPLFSRLGGALERHGNETETSLVLIYDSRHPSTSTYHALLDMAGPTLEARDAEWRNNLTLWDARFDTEKINAFVARYGRGTKAISYPILVSISDPDEEEVEVWTSEWMREYEKKKPCYPISGGWWSVDGDWSPSIQKVRTHLFKSPNHTDGEFDGGWLNVLSFEELQSVHSDHHREMTGTGKVHWNNVNKCPLAGGIVSALSSGT